LFGNLKCGSDQNRLNSKSTSKNKSSKELNKLPANGEKEKQNEKKNSRMPAREFRLLRTKLDKNRLI